MEEINLIFFDHPNFGDQLSKFIFAKLLNLSNNLTKYKITYNKPNKSKNIIMIGSYIQTAPNNCIIFGSGIRTNPPIEKNSHLYRDLNVCAIRGPLSKAFLEDKNIKVPDVFGDPALLLPLFYKPTINFEHSNKICVIPHFTNYSKYKNINSSTYLLTNPSDNWQNVINNICSCKYVISSSLHGLICSDAYNKPNIWLDEYPLNEGDFKFKDYFLSQSRNYIKINKLESFDEKLLYTEGNKININKLIQAFPL